MAQSRAITVVKIKIDSMNQQSPSEIMPRDAILQITDGSKRQTDEVTILVVL